MRINPTEVKIEASWKEVLQEEFSKPYFLELKKKLIQAQKEGEVYPPNSLLFQAFKLCPFSEVKVILLGQDPYHGKGQAMGLSFSVPQGKRIPPSLKNIYKELYNDLGIPEADSGDLTFWAKQGLLLLNATLSVSAHKANSHSNFGWQNFTDAVIKILSEKKENLVFLLWGTYAKSKAKLIDENKHLILEAAHPSPLARGAFFGNKAFSKTNAYLVAHNKKPIDWDLSHA